MRHGYRLFFGAFFSLVAGSAMIAQSSAPAPTTVTAERLLKPEAGDWMSYRRTYDVTAFSPLKQIDRNSVKRLRPVWSYSMKENVMRGWAPTPVVSGRLMYVGEGAGRVLAFDVVTGDVVWIHERTYPADASISEAYPRQRGVSIFNDTVYWGTADSYLVALDAKTGAVKWEVKTGDYHTGEGHSHPPLIADGKVFLGHAGGDLGAQGQFRALDAATGKLLWTVYTAPRPGDPGFETWTNKDYPPRGGAPWNTASYDPELRLVYFSTGQPAPWSRALRGDGDALYTNTVLAVDAQTGKIRWHFQLNPADDWDRAGYENMLVDLPIGGRMRKALIQTGKMGWGVVLDRQTGEFLHAFKTGFDNVVTGWTPKGQPILNPALIPTPADVDSGKVFEVCPYIHGVRNLQAPSFSPLTKLYYLGVNNTCMDAKIVSATYRPGRGFGGVSTTPKMVPGYDYIGEFVAFDPVTGKRAWVYRPPSGAAMTASALATAGGVVFGGTADRQFFALNSDTGALLWQMRLNGDVSGAPVTFTVDGKQYLAIGAGGRMGPTLSLAPLTGANVSDGSGVMWVFAVDDADDARVSRRGRPQPVMTSTSGVPAPAPAAARAPVSPDAPRAAQPAAANVAANVTSAQSGLFTVAQAARGEEQFKASCSSCHKPEEQTGANFKTKWGHGSMGELFTVISTTMPRNSPGSLSPDAYASILAFYLRQSGYAAGASELPADTAALSRLPIER